MKINKKQQEMLMYCGLAFVIGYLLCMYAMVMSINKKVKKKNSTLQKIHFFYRIGRAIV